MGSTIKNINENFNRMIERLIDRQVVPFLGAGISLTAKHPNEIYKDINKTQTMIEEVTEDIVKNCNSKLQKDQDSKNCSCCIIKKQLFCNNVFEKNGTIELCSLLGKGFLHFGEVVCNKVESASEQVCISKINSPSSSLTSICEMWEWGCKEHGERTNLVRDVLHINEFNNLEPTNAHRYLAYLAREFLIDEVITTNYDACLENAYKQSFEDRNNNETRQKVVVINSLTQYRDNSGKKFEKRHEEKSVNILKIFKINGDAEAYKHIHNNNWAQSILLTESDLQNWRERYWAQDLFRDRLRSRTILFCGFGSDEPQVRHTVLQICEEFSVGENEQMESKLKDNRKKNANAPYLAVYGDALSFNQHQILQAFSPKFQKNNTTGTGPLKLLNNVFSGKNRDFFQSNNQMVEKSELTADLFFERVYQAAFGKLLGEVDNPDSPVYQYLIAINPSLSLLLHNLLLWMYPKGKQKPFGQFKEILQISDAFIESADTKSTLLSQWVYIVRYGVPQESGRVKGKGIYMAIADRQVLIITILLLLYLLFARQNRAKTTVDGINLGENISYDNGLGLKIKAQARSLIPYDIYLAHADCAQQLLNLNYLEEGMCADIARPGVQIVLGNGFIHPRKTQVYVGFREREERAVKTIYQIPFAFLFKNHIFNEKVDLPSCLDSFYKILRYPAIVSDKSFQMKGYYLLSEGGRYNVQ